MEIWVRKCSSFEKGLLGAITGWLGFLLSSFHKHKWREEIIHEETEIAAFAHPGHGVLDNVMVEPAAYVLRKLPDA